jgi:tetrapyrrole methylase family protein / MazG family protein
MEEFSRLVGLMAALRGEEGCAWDKKQTEKAFRSFLLEEAYEVVDAIEKDDPTMLKEELGDLLFHIVFISQICKEKGLFEIREVIDSVYTKMYNRHPHVFRQGERGTPIEQRWEELKKAEKNEYAAVSGVPKVLPALLRSYVISKRAARMGFDWETVDGIYDKIEEEIRELREAEETGNQALLEEELGDLLFTVANLSRFHSIDPEGALRLTLDKFIRRFAYVEKNMDKANPDPKAMDELWNEVKRLEKKGE